MKIIVLNGSPKGLFSVTTQYVNYIQKQFPQNVLKIINISWGIKQIEQDRKLFNEIIDEIKSSDGVLWSFPVYNFLVPSQYKRFIELIWERGVVSAFKDKYTATLSTSARVMDHTAHLYLRGICDDLNMNFVDYYSADANDLFKKDERNRLTKFADCYFESIEKKYPIFKQSALLTCRSFEYVPGKFEKKIETNGKKILIITDSDEKETNLGRMIERFKNLFIGEVEVININDIDIKGGCMGCLKCWYDNVCAYDDEYTAFFKTKVTPADIVVTAGAIKDRYFSAKHKEFIERAFYNHHKPWFAGKQLGGIVSGPASQLHILLDMAMAGSEYSLANNVGCVTDEFGDSAEIDASMQAFAQRLVSFAEKKYTRPMTFLGLGTRRIIRDLAWKMRVFLPDDHKYYKKNGLYDFPYKDLKAIAMILLFTPLIKIPAFRKEMTKKIKTEMIRPYKKIIDSD